MSLGGETRFKLSRFFLTAEKKKNDVIQLRVEDVPSHRSAGSNCWLEACSPLWTNSANPRRSEFFSRRRRVDWRKKWSTDGLGDK